MFPTFRSNFLSAVWSLWSLIFAFAPKKWSLEALIHPTAKQLHLSASTYGWSRGNGYARGNPAIFGPFWDLLLFGVILNNLTLDFIGFAQCLPATSALSAVEYFRYRDQLIPSHHICATLLFFIFVDGLPLSLQVVSVGIEKNHQRHPSVRDVRPGQWWTCSPFFHSQNIYEWYNKGPNDTTKGHFAVLYRIIGGYLRVVECFFCSSLLINVQFLSEFAQGYNSSIISRRTFPRKTWFFSLRTGVLRLQHGRHPMVLSAKDDQIAVPQQHRPAVHRQNPGRTEGKPQWVGVSVRLRDNLQKILDPWNKTMDKQWNLTSISVFGSIVANQVNPNNGRLM